MKRPELFRLLSDCQAGDVLLVEQVDRLSRLTAGDWDRLKQEIQTRRVRVVGYNWKDEPADALAWLERLNNPYWLVLADAEGGTAIDFGIYGAPETFLIDANGIVRWKYVGPMTDAIVRDQLLPALDAAERGR